MAIDQIAQSGLSSLKVIYYSAQLFSRFFNSIAGVGASALVADITGIASDATEQSNPRASARLGWASFATGILSLGLGLLSNARGMGKVAVKQHYFAMGKNAHSPVVFGDNASDLTAAYYFIDEYRGKPRLNIAAHGNYRADIGGAKVQLKIGGVVTEFTGYELAHHLGKSGIDFSQFGYARTIVCDSANGGATSFGQGFAQRSGLKTKAYEDIVWVYSRFESLIQTWKNNNHAYSDLYTRAGLDSFVARNINGLSNKDIIDVSSTALYQNKSHAFTPRWIVKDAYQLKSRRPI